MVSQMLLDSAHGAMVIYNLCKDNNKPFIVMNPGNTKKRLITTALLLARTEFLFIF